MNRWPNKALHELEALANGSRNRVIQSSYHGASGTLLMDQKKYQDAIAHLEEDQDNPFTLELLVQAYYQTEQSEKLHETEANSAAPTCPPWSRPWSCRVSAPSGRICRRILRDSVRKTAHGWRGWERAV